MVYVDFTKQDFEKWAAEGKDDVELGSLWYSDLGLKGTIKKDRITFYAEEDPGIVCLGTYIVKAPFEPDFETFFNNLGKSIEESLMYEDSPITFYLHGLFGKHHENDDFLVYHPSCES